MNPLLQAGGLVVAQIVMLLALSPLIIGVIRKVKARLQCRRGAGVLQPYADLAKLFRKQPVVGSVIEFEDAFERVGIIRQTGQYGYTAISKLGGNEPVRTALINGSNRKHINLLGSLL